MVFRDVAGNPTYPPGVERAYAPAPGFVANCSLTALPSDCTARIEPRQLNAVVSELVSLAECLDPNGPWDCGSSKNLCNAFVTWNNTNIGSISAKVNRAGDTMAGPLILAADPTAPMQAATKQYVENLVTGVGGYLPLTGGTITGSLAVAGIITGSNPIVSDHGSGYGTYYFGLPANNRYLQYSPIANAYGLAGGRLAISDGTPSTSPATGALTVAGGVGIVGQVHTNSVFVSEIASGYSFQMKPPSGPGWGIVTYVGGDFGIDEVGVTQRFRIAATTGNVSIQSTTASTSPTTGALTIAGGLGVNGISTLANASIVSQINFANSSGTPGAFNSTLGGAIGNAGDGAFCSISRTGSGGPAYFANINTDGGAFMFQRSGTAVGTITVNPTSTAYNTTSDGRLKEDFQPVDASGVIDAIKVHDFAWRATGKRACGVIAQEAAEVFPDAVSHDQERDWWGTDYSKFVPLLLAEVQALRRRVAELENMR